MPYPRRLKRIAKTENVKPILAAKRLGARLVNLGLMRKKFNVMRLS